MKTYVVFPLDEEKLPLYVAQAHRLREGALVSGENLTPEKAALAVRGDLGAVSVRKFAVVDATVIDFEPVPGQETMRADEGPHRPEDFDTRARPA